MLAASPVRVKQPCSWRGCCPHASHALLVESSSAVKGSVSLLAPLLALLWQDACQHRLSPGHHSLRVSPIPKCSFWLEAQGCVFTECSFASVYQSYCGGTMTHGAQREPCHLSGRAHRVLHRDISYGFIADYHKFGHYMSHALNALYFLENSPLHIDGRDWQSTSLNRRRHISSQIFLYRKVRVYRKLTKHLLHREDGNPAFIHMNYAELVLFILGI